jgi:hypothetical protein
MFALFFVATFLYPTLPPAQTLYNPQGLNRITQYTLYVLSLIYGLIAALIYVITVVAKKNKP